MKPLKKRKSEKVHGRLVVDDVNHYVLFKRSELELIVDALAYYRENYTLRNLDAELENDVRMVLKGVL